MILYARTCSACHHDLHEHRGNIFFARVPSSSLAPRRCSVLAACPTSSCWTKTSTSTTKECSEVLRKPPILRRGRLRSRGCHRPVQAQLSANQWLEQEGMGVGAGLVDDNTDVAPAVEMLLNISGSRQRTVSLIKTHPEVLQAPLEAWQIFLGTYGISDSSFFKLLSSHPHLFTSGVALFSAGRGMAYLQSLGLSAREVSQVVCRVPELLVRCDPDHCAPVVHFLTSPLAGEGSSNEGSGTSGRGDDDDDDDGGGALYVSICCLWMHATRTAACSHLQDMQAERCSLLPAAAPLLAAAPAAAHQAGYI
mmetsp:Transcript_17845/g.49881  ORF Transcript_17845/g.49881 Transcript_17845/m.49881 type:complete len:308 (+) Transcript_17845:44-967(+)